MALDPDLEVPPLEPAEDLDDAFGLLLGAESVRVSMQRDTLLVGTRREERPTEPLPEAAAPPPLEIPPVPDDVEVEAIAMHVPEECFYVRFGSFANFQWVRRTVDHWGGNARDLVAVRSLNYGIRDKLEKQLALRETVLSDGTWRSSAWPETSLYSQTEVPADYRFPFLEWFHGLSLEFSIDETSLTVHVEVDVTK